MLKPHFGHVLCKKVVNENEQIIESGIKFTKQSLPIYEIVDMSNLSIDLELSKNDWIITNSIPTKLVDNNETYWLIGQEYIAAKVEKRVNNYNFKRKYKYV